MKTKALLVAIVFCLSTAAHSAYAGEKPHVLMISIDGMRPDDITQADLHHLKIPMLRSFLNGTYADGVVNSVPANTYPNHTTLVTGVWPAEHGIYNNIKFDPLQVHPGEWYWYAKDVRVPTLWQAAHAAGLKTASIGWPVTNGGVNGIDFLITEFAQSEDGGEIKGLNGDIPEGLRKNLDPDHKATAGVDGDVKKVLWATALMKRENPNFFTLHMNNLDHAQHETGLWSDLANKTLETLDAQISELVKTELEINPDAIIVIVSDHGFINVDTRINLGVLFIKAGLQPLAKKGDAPFPPDTPWEAAAWDAGGTSAIMLHDPNDKVVLAKVDALLKDAAKKPEYGIARILTADEIKKIGGFPDASFLVEFKPGFASNKSLKGSVIVSTPGHGAHGFLSDRPEMHSSLFMMGKGVAAHRDLGTVDMRQIAPTVAQMLGVSIPTAKQPPVHYRP